MFKNYLKIAFRNLQKNKVYTFINVVGLAIGMSIFLIISMYFMHELSYNKFHEKYKSIYSIQIGEEFSTTAPLATTIEENIPEFELITRIDDSYGGGQTPIFVINDAGSGKKIKFKDVLFVDQNFFDMFSFNVIYGNVESALTEPYSIVLTKSASQNLFGTENSIGKTIHYIGHRNGKPEMDLTVTAIVEDIPSNSTISFNALASFSTLYAVKPTGLNLDEDWVNWGYKTYILLKEQNVQAFQSKLSQLWLEKENMLWPKDEHKKISITTLAEVPFYNNNKRSLLYLIQLIGVFILTIAIINFVNLTIAKSAARAKEVGIRKVAGSLRIDLIKQFLVESILFAGITTPAALVIFDISKSQFYKIINKQIPLDILNQPIMILFLFATVLITGLIAGIYPALVLSSFKPASIIRGEKIKGKKGISLRFALFVFQFVISVTLITCTIFISRQIEYLKTKPLGYSNKNIIHCKQSQQINEKYDVLKQKLLQNPNIISMTRSNHALGQEFNISTGHEVKGIKKPYYATTVDPDFIPTMGIKIIEGRAFSWEIPTDKHWSIIVNESFVKEFELEKPIGTEIDFLDFLNFKPKIIGVVKDFHYNSFHKKLEPSALWYADWNGRINIKISDQNQSQTLKYIEKTWNELSPQAPFEYEFLDETYDKLYKAEEELKQIVILFSIIAIVITCLGLFGLISYSAVQRTKEIGIRKVLGASVADLIVLLAKDYFQWVIIANIIALPLAYYFMNKWLEDFAYRIDISWWMFALSGGIALAIALATVSFQAIKAATANPVEALRYE